VSTRLLTILLFSSLGVGHHFLQRVLPSSRQQVILVSNRPSVYISFEHLGERQATRSGEPARRVWLAVHNNTRWAISLCTERGYILPPIAGPLTLADGRHVLGLRDGVEVDPCFQVEAIKGQETLSTSDGGVLTRPIQAPSTIPMGTTGDILGSTWLPSGFSVVFSVPRADLAEHLEIYLSFAYEWESSKNDSGTGEPEHRIYFRASDLPRDSR
jgi:hypothetical protein